MKEIPNWIIVLILLVMCLALIILVYYKIPQLAVEKVKVIIKVIWGTIA